LSRIVNILGNGPSVWMFMDNQHGITITCNVPPFTIENHWATCLGDFKMMNALMNNEFSLDNMKWILGTRPKIYMGNHPMFYMQKAHLIQDFYTHLPPYALNSTVWSVGHLATHYAATALMPDEIHMWGFDSMFSYDLSSSTDLVVASNREEGNRYRMNNNWRPIWTELFKEFEDIKFIIHYKKNVDLQLEVGYNVSVQSN
jgi:hypothetical protein